MEGNRQINREMEVYNLDAAIAVGYRDNSVKTTYLGYGLLILYLSVSF